VRPSHPATRCASRAGRELAGRGLVVHYDADTEQGVCYVPRRPGVDLDLIREPYPA